MKMDIESLMAEVKAKEVVATKAFDELGRIFGEIRKHETAESYWDSLRRMGISPEYAQLTIQVANLAQRDPSVLSLGLCQIFVRLGNGDDAKVEAMEDIYFEQIERQLAALSPAQLDALLSTQPALH